MKSCSTRALSFALTLVCIVGLGELLAAPVSKVTHIGYIYPAGGRQGSTFQVTVGGQYLVGASEIYFSSPDIQASVVEYIKPLRVMEQQTVRKKVKYLQQVHTANKNGRKLPDPPEDLMALPDHPLLRGMEEMTSQELKDLLLKIFNPLSQDNAQLAEQVVLEVQVGAAAASGVHEMRLQGRSGLSNPLRFQVGEFSEISEVEPNNLKAAELPILSAPSVLNGQIFPGDVDRIKLKGRKGQHLLFDVYARRLIPYLADAVPGWFQAIVTLYDAEGNEVAYADDYRFHPDPYFISEIPEDGEYELEIRDAIFRGREDFVYRIELTPTIKESVDEIAQANAPETKRGVLKEKEPNGELKEANRGRLPIYVEGCISEPCDVDGFMFHAEAGQEIVMEVMARRELESPLDALIKLSDAAGNVIAWNDDYVEKEGHLHRGPGLLTHHADAYLRGRVPKRGIYIAQVQDAQGHGGEEYIYRLRVSLPQPKFELRVLPSSLTLTAGRTLPIDIHVLRKDGFKGGIDLSLVNAPEGFKLSGARIPEGKNNITVTLTAPWQATAEPVALNIEGVATIGGRKVKAEAIPADDTMQAFLWRHIVTAQQFLVKVAPPKAQVTGFKRTGPDLVRMRKGKVSEIKFKAPPKVVTATLKWELRNDIPGVRLKETIVDEKFTCFELAVADAPVGFKDNLIFEATAIYPAGKGRKKEFRQSIGVLHAVPMEIIR